MSMSLQPAGTLVDPNPTPDDKSKKKRSLADGELHVDTVYYSPADVDSYDEYGYFDEISSEDENRGTWTGRPDFILSCIGFSVGLGNVWRFPYLCYSSGGGAFLFPYVFFLVTCALPFFLLETSYGQFVSLSPIASWKVCPLFKGVGYGMVIVSGTVCIYYNIILAWTLFYLFSTMQSTLPWSRCDNSWNTPSCIGPGSILNETEQDKKNGTQSSVEFWERNVLNRSKGLEHFGSVRWPLFICLWLSWFAVFLCLCKGVKSSGKVVYVTATFPYLVLSILLIKCAMLPGAKEGLKWYLIPQWGKLASFKVWGDAALQIFYSVGMAWGSLITLASYNKFNNNVFRDAMIVPSVNCFTSVFAGLVIFSVLGFMSHTTGKPIEDVVTQGPGLIFIVYPEAVTKMPVSHFWAVMFFLMILTIGMDSQFGMFETMTSAFVDEYPKLLRKHKLAFTAFMCVLEFAFGVPMIFEGGFYLLTLCDWYSSSFSLMLLSMTECLVISWIYGVDRFMKDIQLMTGNKPSIYWKIMWKFVTPIVVLTIWIFNLYQMQRVSLDDYQYPEWAVMVGWSFALISILPLPIYAIYAVIQVESGSFRQRILLLIQPTANFGPSQIEDRERYFQTFNDFDWLRYNAAKNRMDWRTYKKYEAGKDKSSSNIAPDNHLPAVSTEDINILVEKMTSQQKLFLGGMFLEEAGDCQKLIEENNEVLGQVENEQTGHRETRYWDFDESLNGKNGKHTRCYSI